MVLTDREGKEFLDLSLTSKSFFFFPVLYFLLPYIIMQLSLNVFQFSWHSLWPITPRFLLPPLSYTRFHFSQSQGFPRHSGDYFFSGSWAMIISRFPVYSASNTFILINSISCILNALLWYCSVLQLELMFCRANFEGNSLNFVDSLSFLSKYFLISGGVRPFI